MGDSNQSPLSLEATALPTVPKSLHFLPKSFFKRKSATPASFKSIQYTAPGFKPTILGT